MLGKWKQFPKKIIFFKYSHGLNFLNENSIREHDPTIHVGSKPSLSLSLTRTHTLSFITSKGYIYIYIYDKVVNLFKEEPFGLASAQTYGQIKSYIFYFYWNVRHLLLLLFV